MIARKLVAALFLALPFAISACGQSLAANSLSECQEYARTAVAMTKVAIEGGCIAADSQGRWSTNFDAHWDFCMTGVKKETLTKETAFRSYLAQPCGCRANADQAIHNVQKDQGEQCGLTNTDAAWSNIGSTHIDRCMSESERSWFDWTTQQQRSRSSQLERCLSQMPAFCRAWYERGEEQDRLRRSKMGCTASSEVAYTNIRWGASKRSRYSVAWK
jgi:hypothetical protein